MSLGTRGSAHRVHTRHRWESSDASQGRGADWLHLQVVVSCLGVSYMDVQLQLPTGPIVCLPKSCTFNSLRCARPADHVGGCGVTAETEPERVWIRRLLMEPKLIRRSIWHQIFSPKPWCINKLWRSPMTTRRIIVIMLPIIVILKTHWHRVNYHERLDYAKIASSYELLFKKKYFNLGG